MCSRFYRQWMKDKSLRYFHVQEEETDLAIMAEADFSLDVRKWVIRARQQLKDYIARHPEFLRSLKPVKLLPRAPQIARQMTEAAGAYGVGPMAAVAGAIADYVGWRLARKSKEVIVENGGDVFLRGRKARTVMVYCGQESPFSGKLRIRVQPEGGSLGVCTSSATVGHSLSFGHADAAVAIASSATLADAAATAIGNMVQRPEDIPAIIEREKQRGALKGLVIAAGSGLGLWGEVEVVP